MSMLNHVGLLQQQLLDNGYHFSDEVQQKFLKYLELLNRWNQKYNLTAIRNIPDMITHHVLDSLSLLPFIKAQRIIDVGSGAGLPGLILAIPLPEKYFCLLDSNNKKTRFLTQVVLELQLKNVSIVHARAEHCHPEQCFDQVITRAFSSLKNMLNLTQHLLDPEGEFLAMKGVYPKKEIEEISENFRVVAADRLKIKGLNEKRCLIKINKLSSGCD